MIRQNRQKKIKIISQIPAVTAALYQVPQAAGAPKKSAPEPVPVHPAAAGKHRISEQVPVENPDLNHLELAAGHREPVRREEPRLKLERMARAMLLRPKIPAVQAIRAIRPAQIIPRL